MTADKLLQMVNFTSLNKGHLKLQMLLYNKETTHILDSFLILYTW